MNRPTHLNIDIDFQLPVRASIPIHQDTDLETAVRSAYTAARDLALDLAAGLHHGPTNQPHIRTFQPRYRIHLHPADIPRDDWLSDRPLTWGGLFRRSDITLDATPEPHTLQTHSYLPWDNCPTPDGEHCALQIDHDWKEGATHTCAEIPGHRMHHTCTCGHEWQDPR